MSITLVFSIACQTDSLEHVIVDDNDINFTDDVDIVSRFTYNTSKAIYTYSTTNLQDFTRLSYNIYARGYYTVYGETTVSGSTCIVSVTLQAASKVDSRKYKINSSLFDFVANKDKLTYIDLGKTAPDDLSLNETFRDMTNLHSVVNMPSAVNSMRSTFANCQSLLKAPEIPSSVVNLGNGLETANKNTEDEEYYGCFGNCVSLEVPPTIPNSVTDMSGTFYRCSSLKSLPNVPYMVTNLSRAFGYCECVKDAPSIGSRVENMDYTFVSCYNLVNAPVIPGSVTSMESTFLACHNLIYSPVVPTNVSSLRETFGYCYNMTTTSIIPSSVTDLHGTFHHCAKITNAPTVPTYVTDMRSTFNCCANLTGAVNIYSYNVAAATYCFNGSNLRKDVYVPFPGVYNAIAMVPDTDPITAYYTSNSTLEYATGYPTSYVRDTSSDKSVDGVSYYGWTNSDMSATIYTNTNTPVNNSTKPYFYSDFRNISTVSTTLRSFLAAGYDSRGTKDNVYLKDITGTYSVLEINPTPSSALVLWQYNGTTYGGKSLICKNGDTVTYEVSAPEYDTVTGSITASKDEVIDVELILTNGNKVDVTDYEYTKQGIDVTLTRYIGSASDVDTPQAEPDDEE